MSDEFEAEAERLFECAHNNFGWKPIEESLRKAYEAGRAKERDAANSLLSETLRIYGRWLDGTFRERIEELIGVAPPKSDHDGPRANLHTPWRAPK